MEGIANLGSEVDENKDDFFPFEVQDSLNSTCVENSSASRPSPSRAHFSVPVRKGPPRPQTPSWPHARPHHGPKAVMMCSKQMVTSMGTKAAWLS